MGKFLDMHHIAYIIISVSLTILLLTLAKRYLKGPKGKSFFLKVFAFLTVFLHISGLWVYFLRDGHADVASNILFPIYFCNMSMYALLVVALIEDKKSRVFRHMATFVAYAGSFGALVSLVYPDYYFGAASMFEWGVFKSMTSHSTMLIGSLWLFIAGYAKISYSNILTYSGGLLVYLVVGLGVNAIFVANGLNHPNAMYLLHPPLPDVPMMNFLTMPLLMLVAILIFVNIYQLFTLRHEKTMKVTS